jgi:predicted ATPase
MTLNHLSHAQVVQLVTSMKDGKLLPHEVLAQIIEKTDGVPLFVEEITKAILESGQLTAVDGHDALTGSFSIWAIPATLQDSLMARLDRLVTAKGVAQYAAVLGRQFSYELLQAVSQVDEAMLQHELSRLVEAEIVYQRGIPPQAIYTFKHTLIQDAAYASLLKSTRQRYHQRIAHVLESQFPETTEGQPEVLARHCTEAGLIAEAVGYWQQAAQCAVQRSDHVAALAHLHQGLGLLATLPETPQRLQREVHLLIALGASLLATQGFAAPEVGETYTRAHKLCQPLADPHQLFPVLRGLYVYSFARAEYQRAHALAEQLLALAHQAQDAAMLVAAHRAVGTTLFSLGEIALAHTHYTQGIALYDPQQYRTSVFLYGEDARVICHSYAALMLWLLGYPDQGLARSHEAMRQAQQSAHPLSLNIAWGVATMFSQFRRAGRAAQECAETALTLAKEQGFPFWMAYSAILRGWALAQQGQAVEGTAQMHQGLRAHRATQGEQMRLYFLALLADVQGTLGEPEAGLTVLSESLALVDKTGERWYEAELHRLQGALLLQQSFDNHTEAETQFHQAMTIAQNQSAKSWELRGYPETEVGKRVDLLDS